MTYLTPAACSRKYFRRPGALEQAVDVIAQSKMPVMVLGRGAKWSGAGDAALKFGKRIGALIATSLRAKNWLAEDEYHAGISGMYATKAARRVL